MKPFVFIAALLCSVSAQAQTANFDTSAGAAYRPTMPLAPISQEVREQIRTADAHARRTYDDALNNGGCNADVLSVEIAAYCWAAGADGRPNSANPHGPVGASQGGSDN